MNVLKAKRYAKCNGSRKENQILESTSEIKRLILGGGSGMLAMRDKENCGWRKWKQEVTR